MPRQTLEHTRLIDAYERRRPLVNRYRWEGAFLFEAQERERVLLRALRRGGFLPLSGRKILDVGCGTGRWLKDLLRWDADPELVAGVEIRPDAVALARRQLGPSIPIHQASADALPFPDESFDLAVQGTVLSSVLDDQIRAHIGAETLRVLKPGGALLWYDFCFNNPWNADVRAVTMRDLRQIFPGCDFHLVRAVPAPPLLRAASRLPYLVAYLLARIPPICTFYAGLIVKRTNASERVSQCVPRFRI